jgi:hypothetical protein
MPFRKDEKMETLQTIQQLAPATTVAALLALPWIAALVMHAFSSTTSSTLDDKWNLRAAAAMRWAGTLSTRKTNNVSQLNVRRAKHNLAAARARVTGRFPHAA